VMDAATAQTPLGDLERLPLAPEQVRDRHPRAA
jgi:hypothetical protein